MGNTSDQDNIKALLSTAQIQVQYEQALDAVNSQDGGSLIRGELPDPILNFYTSAAWQLMESAEGTVSGKSPFGKFEISFMGPNEEGGHEDLGIRMRFASKKYIGHWFQMEAWLISDEGRNANQFVTNSVPNIGHTGEILMVEFDTRHRRSEVRDRPEGHITDHPLVHMHQFVDAMLQFYTEVRGQVDYIYTLSNMDRKAWKLFMHLYTESNDLLAAGKQIGQILKHDKRGFPHIAGVQTSMSGPGAVQALAQMARRKNKKAVTAEMAMRTGDMLHIMHAQYPHKPFLWMKDNIID